MHLLFSRSMAGPFRLSAAARVILLIGMKEPSQFDFWYAVHNTRVVVMPSRRLETFGATMLNYHLISELMDTVNKVRVREGRVQAQRPQIVTPSSFASGILDGFGQEAERYAEWLRENSRDIRILQYGFVIKKEEISEHVISDPLDTVVERVEKEVRGKDDPLAAVIVGVEAPWEVCLIKTLVEVSGRSFPGNVRELERRHMFDEQNGLPRAVRDEIEDEFRGAEQDRSRIDELGRSLQRRGVFEEYEDRFFSLVKSSRRRK